MKTELNWPDSLRWLRDKAGVWLASTTTFTFMWISVAVAICVLFFWDATWSGHQAPEGPGMVLSFRAGGWVVRLWTIFALVGAVALFRHKANWLGSILIATWLATSIMSYGHALGFVATGQMERYAGGAVAEGKAEIKTASNEDKIAAIEKLKQETRDDLALKVTPLNEEIRQIDSDGKLNDEIGMEQKKRRAEIEDAAQEKIDAYDAQILAISDKGETDQIESNEDVATAVKFDPLYMWIGGWVHGPDPTDDQLRGIAQKIGAYWALLIELVGGAGPAILYAAHAHFADHSDRKRKAERFSEDVPDGMVNINMTEEEWKAYEDALAAADGAPPKDPADLLRIGQEGYWIERIGKALKTRMRNPTAEGMFNTYFSGIGSVHELRAHLSLMLKRGALSQDHFDFITREGKYAPAEQMTNGEDHSEEGANDVDDTGTDQLPAVG